MSLTTVLYECVALKPLRCKNMLRLRIQTLFYNNLRKRLLRIVFFSRTDTDIEHV